MDYSKSPYFHVAHARDLTGKDRVLYRALEILPGALTWGTLLLIIVLSWQAPVIAAYLIIAFDLYWVLKTFYLTTHHRHNWRRLRHNMKVNWSEKIQEVAHEQYHHLIILPFYNEDETVVEQNIRSLLDATYDHTKLVVVLAAEERAGESAKVVARNMEERYADKFGHFIVTFHPDNLPGEIRGKGPNISYAAEEARVRVLDAHHIAYESVIVSALDIDTVVAPQYFLCLTWHFATTPEPHKASFQPIPLYNNNIWYAPAISRVAALSSTYWQMIQQERQEKLSTFSSHALSFAALHQVGYWQKNMISDDSRIFWNLYLANNGDYKVVPLSYPVSMDANLAASFWQTLINIYKQHRRWMWGVENFPYMVFGFIKNSAIPLRAKVFHTLVQLEGWWSLTTHPLIILLLGWLPLIVGGEAFRDTVLSYNLPNITRDLMMLAMLGLVLSAVIAFTIIPPMPQSFTHRRFRYFIMAIQWFLVPITIIVFGAIPGIDAQTRLMLGKYMGSFWVTPKFRTHKDITEQTMPST